MDLKLVDIVVENITQKCLPDHDEAKLVSKLMLVVLKGEATAEEATQNRCISATKLQDYVNAARFALKSFDVVIQQAISQVRQSSPISGQVPTEDAPQASPPDATSENALTEASYSQPLSRKRRCSATRVASADKKSKTVEPHEADASDDTISEFNMPDGVQMDATAQDWADLSAIAVPPMAPATRKMKLKFSTLGDGTVVCGHCKMTFQTRSGVYNHYLNRHASAEDVFSCTQCNVKCLKQKALERHILRKHTLVGTPDAADEPSTSGLTMLDVSQDRASTMPLPVDHGDLQHDSSSNSWLLSMCNVNVKKELDSAVHVE